MSAEASDLVRFVNILREPNTPNLRSVLNSELQTTYAKIGDDEQRINNVVLEQLPKVKAFAKSHSG